MELEIAVGLIGVGGALGGSLLGGLSTFLGVVYQQQRQAKQTILERQTEMTHQAIDSIMVQVQELRRLAWERPKAFKWTAEMGACVEAIRLASLRLPQAGLREPIEAACNYQFGASKSLRGDMTSMVGDPAVRVVAMTSQVQQRLGSYLRGESPAPVDGFLKDAFTSQRKFRQQLSEGKLPEI
jgi:hypothetical protein